MKVMTERGIAVAMSNLVLGDKVLTRSNHFEPIYSFGHRHETIQATYLQIHVGQPDGEEEAILEMSTDHMVFVSKDQTKPASSLSLGDSVWTANGTEATVTRIQTVDRRGAFAPFTPSGSIFVNGVVASTFVSLQEGEAYLQLGVSTQFSHQWLAHLFETPHRLAFRLIGLEFVTDGNRSDGMSEWIYLPHQIATWLLHQHWMVVVTVLLMAIPCFSVLWCFEQMMMMVFRSHTCFLFLTETAAAS